MTLLTKELGVVSCFYQPSKRDQSSWVEPFVVVKGQLVERRGELLALRELVGERWYLGLRERPLSLQALRKMLHSLLRVVEERTPIPLLFSLFEKLIGSLSEGEDPEKVSLLFRVKLALHEGRLEESAEGRLRDWLLEARACRRAALLSSPPPEAGLFFDRLLSEDI